jgi:hypothetical protein
VEKRWRIIWSAAASAITASARRAGVRLFATGHLEQLGGDFAVVYLNTLDDVSPEEFGAIPIKYADGRNDNWWNEPTVKSYL